MELIYLYIRKYENLFEEQEFNFSSNFSVAFKEGKLIVEENKNALKHYYGENVNNVVMFLGQNGMGKSTLLDILGMRRTDRNEDTYTRSNRERKIKHSYFILYHLYDDYFAFEFIDDSFLTGESKITNLDMQNQSIEGALYRIPMGTIFKLENGIFEYCDNIILQWREKNNITKKLEYAYITSDRYNNRISNNYRISYEEYLFERKYYLEENSFEFLYKYFVYLKEIDDGLLLEKNIYIKNSIGVDLQKHNEKKEVEDYLYEKKKELDTLFNLKSRIQIEMEEQLLGIKEAIDTRSKKEIFLDTFCAEAIEYYFLVQFVGWSENRGFRIDTSIKTSLTPLVEGEMSKNKDDLENELMEIGDFHEEYHQLLFQIGKNKSSEGIINLKNVLEYVLTRVEIAASSIIDICDKEAVLKIISLLEELPEAYYTGKKTINVKCDLEKPDKRVSDLLKWYDNYYKIRNDENGGNNLFRIIKVELSKMSEGQRALLELVSKCVSAIYAINPEDSLVLLIDEPDRTLHPELARKFLNTLLESITKCDDRNIQIVLTSHSPFIVTDILPENVYALEQRDGVRIIQNNKDTYATNIYYLLMDSFMLKNTFGEHSYKQIKNIIKLLNGSRTLTKEEADRAKKVIDRIGEKTVKKKLLQLYKKHDNTKSDLMEQVMNVTDKEKIEKIRKILEGND